MADQAGRVALVTGANTGIGYEAALQLARKGAHVLLGCRNQERASQAIERIQADAPNGSVEWLPLDLADLASVAAAAAQLRETHQQLDVLICNAGVMVPPAGRTVDGFELQFGINHLGHVALVLQLLPQLQAAMAARVVAVSSGAALFGRMVFDDLNFERRGYQPWAAYGQSKLANLLFIQALARRLQRAGSSVLACAAHPESPRRNCSATVPTCKTCRLGWRCLPHRERFQACEQPPIPQWWLWITSDPMVCCKCVVIPRVFRCRAQRRIK